MFENKNFWGNCNSFILGIFNYNVTISENLNSIISGSYNINVTNDNLNTFNKNVVNSVKETVNNTFGKTYTINVYGIRSNFWNYYKNISSIEK